MDITNENFASELPEICETIESCDFIAIDTELSGLVRERNNNRLDLPSSRYSKAITNSRGYFILQFGLSCFTKLDDQRYSNRTYNFYIFPQPHKTFGDVNRTLCIQAHAIQFLSEHNFDFNRLFKHGVSYLTFREKQQLNANLKAERKTRSEANFNRDGVPTFVHQGLQLFCKGAIKQVQDFIASSKELLGRSALVPDGVPIRRISANAESRADDSGPIKVRASERCIDGDQPSTTKTPTLEIHDIGTHSARLILIRAIECLPDADNLWVETSVDQDTNESYLVVEWVEKEIKKARRKSALVAAKGFLEVIETIVLNKKPLVGHNLLFDIVQMINQFIEELTDDYSAFKETCQSLFPLIYDTKYMANCILDPETATINQSRLNDLYCQLRVSKSFPKIQIDHLNFALDQNQVPHQAGFDAYMSGFSFIVMCESYLKKRKGSKTAGKSEHKSVAREPNILREFSNKIHLCFSQEFNCYNLSGEEKPVDKCET